MSELTKKDQQFHWTNEAERAFDTLKQAFTSAPVLATFDPEAEVVVEADASDRALGACLSQKHDDGKWHPVAFFSRKFSLVELNYNIYDKELLAIIYAFKE